jgi:hypothetical protein
MIIYRNYLPILFINSGTPKFLGHLIQSVIHMILEYENTYENI